MIPAAGWYYKWSSNDMLQRVINPQQGKIDFGYDPLGRRVWKESKGVRTNWLWDGNVPLHEWQTTEREPLMDVVTWVFEDGSFVPVARITDKGSQSIVTDYLGTPTQMYDTEGNKTWETQLDIYGRVRTFAGRSLNECPFRYAGQYEDVETGLCYNRARYYDPQMGSYLSQDSIGLAGALNIYAYVHDPNSWLDPTGLSGIAGLVMAGNATSPSGLRTPQDVIPNSGGIIKGQSGLGEVSGKSAFNTVDNMSKVLKDTKVHEITSTKLPEGLAVKADGVDVGGTRAKGHHTIYNTRDMSLDEFNAKLKELETKKIGSINKKGKFTCG